MLTIPRLSLRTLRAFVVTVEQGSISGAASRLNIAASAMAASLDQVEAEMGATLLIRTWSRGIAANAEAQALADRFRDVLETYEAALDSGRALAEG